MNMKRCNKGHFYDSDQYKTCPHCAQQGNQGEPGVTKPLTQAPHPPIQTPPAPGQGNMVLCPNGHYYDASIYSKCPHCASADPGPTDYIKVCPVCGKSYDAKKYSSCPHCKNKDQKMTVALYKRNVVGWLVAVKGPHRGKDFRLQTGQNFVGRGEMMDVCLRDDQAVSRNKHAVVLYEPKNSTFYVMPGESHELAYLNGEVLLEHKTLRAGDILSLGHSELMFMPFCTADGFNWEKQAEEEKAEKRNE